MSRALPCGVPSAMSNRMTSPSASRAATWARVPPIIPAPIRAIFARAIEVSPVDVACAKRYSMSGGLDPQRSGSKRRALRLSSAPARVALIQRSMMTAAEDDRQYEARVLAEAEAWRERQLRRPGLWDMATRATQDRINRIIPERVHQIVTSGVEL